MWGFAMRRALVLPKHSLSLYFWQVVLLAYMAGLICLKSYVLGVLVLLCIVLGDRARRSAWGIHVLVLVAAFAAGACVAHWSLPDKPDFIQSGHAEYIGKKVRFEGTVVRVDALPDARLRVILSDVRVLDALAASDGSTGAEHPDGRQIPPLPGLLILTWQDAPVRPLPGQRLAATAWLHPFHAFQNPGTYNVEEAWALQGAWLRAWMRGEQSMPEISGEGGAAAVLRERLRSGLLDFLTDDQMAMQRGIPLLSTGHAAIPALLFGDRFYLRSEALELLGRATLVHSLALSGMHLGLAALLGLWCARLLGRIYPRIYLYCTRPRLAMGCALPFAVLYLWLGGAPVSLVRAGLMLFFAGLLLWLRRPRPLLDGLFLALLCILLVDPLALFDIRLQLSASAIAAIALYLAIRSGVLVLLRAARERRVAAFVPRAAVWRVLPLNRRVLSFLGRGALNLLLVTVSIQVIQLPLVAYSFGFMGLGGILNVLWLPILSCIVLPAAFLGFVLSCFSQLEPFAAFFLHCAAFLTDGLDMFLRFCNDNGLLPVVQLLRPLEFAVLGFYALLALAAMLWQARVWRDYAGRAKIGLETGGGQRISRLHGALLAVGVACALIPVAMRLAAYADPSLRVIVLDVGQGQSVVFEQGRHRFLLDAGGFAASSFDTGKSIVAPALTWNRPPHLDIAAFSHPDTDHARGLLYIWEHFCVERMAGNGRAGSPALEEAFLRTLARCGRTVESWQAGQSFLFGNDVLVEVLHPPAPQEGVRSLSSNNASLVLRFTRNGRGLVLAAGEVERPILKRLAADADISARVLLLPHHGSASSLSPEFYDAVAPQLALVSCGFANRWDFPKEVVRQSLTERGIPLFSTAEYGQLVFEFGRPLFGADQDAAYLLRPLEKDFFSWQRE